MTALQTHTKPWRLGRDLKSLLFPKQPKQSRQLLVGLLILFFLLLILINKYLTFPLDVERQLLTLRPVFQVKVRVWLALVKTRLGLDVLVTSARRTFAQQAAQHAADPRNPAPSVEAPDIHMQGGAVDVNFLKDGVVILRKASPAADWSDVVTLAKSCGIARWGGNFSGYPDRVHFDDRS